jgi:hypothetical protein
VSRLNAYLSGFASCAVTVAAFTLLTGAKAPPQKFEEIDVGRINVREPDGTLRMVISNRAQFPGAPWKGQEIPRPDRRDYAGLLFINDEGTENGGLIQKGKLGLTGKPDAGLSLTFDRFRQDQVLQLLHAEQGGKTMTQLSINDEPPHEPSDAKQRMQRMDEADRLPREQRAAAYAQLKAEGLYPYNRVRLGTTLERASALTLADAEGRPRLRLMVSADGQPVIQMLDDKGKVAKVIGLDN